MSEAEQQKPESERVFSDRDRDNIGWFWRQYLREKSPWLALVLLMILIEGLVYQQFLRLTENGLRVIFDRGSMNELILVCAAVFGVFILRGAMSFGVPRLSAWVAADAIMKLRGHLIDHLVKLDLAYFEKTRPGENILRLTTQAEGLHGFVGVQLVRAFRDTAVILIVGSYLAWRQPFLFGGAMLVIPLVVIALQFISRMTKSAQRANQEALRGYTSALEEMVSAMRTVKIAGQERMEQSRLREFTELLRQKTIEVRTAHALSMPLVDVAAAVAYSLVIGGGGYMVLSPDFDVDGAAIIAFMFGLALVFDPARRLGQFYVVLQGNMVILDIVRRLLHEQPTIVDAHGADTAFEAGGDIDFDDVEFAYSSEAPLFKKLNITFEGGQTTAIVGPTGSGKTTILSLLARLYDPNSGAITISGKPLEQIKISALRDAFSVVAQDIVIFDNSIFENIRYVRPDAAEADVWAAAEAAEIAELMRDRGDLSVGPRGAQLSGGQRQRIGIARAFLKDAPIVLLDEATSALDQATEERISGALSRLAEGRTTIVIAHRLSSISSAAKIYVLESGRVAEEGSHSQLLEKGGLYAELYNAQKSGYDDAD